MGSELSVAFQMSCTACRADAGARMEGRSFFKAGLAKFVGSFLIDLRTNGAELREGEQQVCANGLLRQRWMRER